MDSKKAGQIVGSFWEDILIANWFDKEWFEDTYKVELTEKEYREIVELYNQSDMCDYITQEIEEWTTGNDILTIVKGKKEE